MCCQVQGLRAMPIGNDGDTYLDQTTGNLYEKVANFWILAGGNNGPQGSKVVPRTKA